MKKLKLISLLLLLASSSCIAQSLYLTGRVEAMTANYLHAPAVENWQLKISWMAVQGSKVKKGDKLITFDAADISGQLSNLKNDLANQLANLQLIEIDQQQKLKQAKFDIYQANIEVQIAQVDADIPAQHISQFDYQQNQLQLKKRQQALLQAEHKLALIEKQIEIELKRDQLTIETIKDDIQRKQFELENMTLLAPVDGYVMYVDHPWNGSQIVTGSTVQPGYKLMQLPQIDQLKIIAWLNEVDIDKLKLGQSAQLNFDALPSLQLIARVHQISKQAVEKNNWGQSAYFTVEMRLPDLSESWLKQLSPGMSVRVLPLPDTQKLAKGDDQG